MRSNGVDSASPPAHRLVLVVKADSTSAERVAHGLANLGGHSFAYGAHWNFVPLAGSQG